MRSLAITAISLQSRISATVAVSALHICSSVQTTKAREKSKIMDHNYSSCSDLPNSGRIACSICHALKPVKFDETHTESSSKDWRIKANPLAWGNPRPEVLVLGFSKGKTQAGEIGRLPHDEIPYRKHRALVMTARGPLDSGYSASTAKV